MPSDGQVKYPSSYVTRDMIVVFGNESHCLIYKATNNPLNTTTKSMGENLLVVG